MGLTWWTMLRKDQRIAITIKGALREAHGKMGFGVLRYSENPIACVIDPFEAGGSVPEITGIPRDVPIVGSVEEAAALGAEVLLLGVAPPGGHLPADWLVDIETAIGLGMSVVNGLHDRLAPRFPQLQPGQWIWDMRVEPEGLVPASGKAADLKCMRLLTVGTDMAVGKMTAGLEILKEARRRGLTSEFVATGQIGMTICGSGVPLDAIRVDFACGAIEREVLRVGSAELVIIEGQGSLVHPGSTGPLPLIRGSMPTHLVMCVRGGPRHLFRYPEIAVPPLREFIRLYEDLASVCGTFPRPKTVGLAMNCKGLSDEEARAACDQASAETGLPAVDVFRHGVSALVDGLRP